MTTKGKVLVLVFPDIEALLYAFENATDPEEKLQCIAETMDKKTVLNELLPQSKLLANLPPTHWGLLVGTEILVHVDKGKQPRVLVHSFSSYLFPIE